MKIAIVDDEEPIRELLCYNLQNEGYQTVQAGLATEAVLLARKEQIDLILLDLMLPDMSGLDVCRILKNDNATKNIPIIMLTAKSEEDDIVKGLNLGADDYVTKPFSVKVLLARINSVLRRKTPHAQDNQLNDECIKIAELTVDNVRHKICVKNVQIDFSATEFAIVDFLARHIDQVFSRKQIIGAIKGQDYPVTERAVDVQILSIRKKFEEAGLKNVIETIRGVGYRWLYGSQNWKN